MRPLLILLLIAVVLLQHKLWLGEGSVIQWWALEKKLKNHAVENTKVAQQNKALEANIKELKSGDQALEEEARYELGMVKEKEEYYQFVD